MLDEWAARMRVARRRPLYEPASTQREVSWGAAEIARLLPHRGPALLVDSIVAIDPVLRRIDVRRSLTADDRGFRGHFEGSPVWPGVLQIELMAQAGLCLATIAADVDLAPSPATTPVPVRLVRVHDALFIAEAVPGERLRVLAEVLDDNGATFICAGQCLGADARVISAAIFEGIHVE